MKIGFGQLHGRTTRLIAGLVLALVAALAWIGLSGPSVEVLVDQAVAGEIVSSDERLKHNHAALLRAAASRLDELEPQDAPARVGLAKLVAGVRYWQVADEIGSTAYAQVERALLAPDDQVVALLKRIWLAEDQNNYEALTRLSISGSSGLDFNSDETLIRAVWPDSGPQGRVVLAHHRIVELFQIAYDSRQPPERLPDQVFAAEPWEGYGPETRRRMQATMQERLGEWAIPTLRAAARGEGVPAEDVGGIRNLLRGLGIEVDEG